VIGGFIFGWAKPVPITWENLRHPKRDMAIVAFAGPASNFVMAILWALFAKLGSLLPDTFQSLALPMAYMGIAGISINIVLMVLNLLPMPPLDGGRVLSGMLPGRWAWQLNRIEPYGFFILLALLATGLLGKLLTPGVLFMQRLVFAMTGLD